MPLGNLFLAMFLQQRIVDPVYATEAAEMMLKARVATEQESIRQRKEDERRRFEAKFNAVVSAVEAFGKKYNRGRGKVWPRREAEALRKAIGELQKALIVE